MAPRACNRRSKWRAPRGEKPVADPLNGLLRAVADGEGEFEHRVFRLIAATGAHVFRRDRPIFRPDIKAKLLHLRSKAGRVVGKARGQFLHPLTGDGKPGVGACGAQDRKQLRTFRRITGNRSTGL